MARDWLSRDHVTRIQNGRRQGSFFKMIVIGRKHSRIHPGTSGSINHTRVGVSILEPVPIDQSRTLFHKIKMADLVCDWSIPKLNFWYPKARFSTPSYILLYVQIVKPPPKSIHDSWIWLRKKKLWNRRKLTQHINLPSQKPGLCKNAPPDFFKNYLFEISTKFLIRMIHQTLWGKEVD